MKLPKKYEEWMINNNYNTSIIRRCFCVFMNSISRIEFSQEIYVYSVDDNALKSARAYAKAYNEIKNPRLGKLQVKKAVWS